MTERSLRELFVWIEVHREQLAEHAGALAEARELVRVSPQRASDRIERIAFEAAAALEALDRVYPRDRSLEDDTAPIEVRS